MNSPAIATDMPSQEASATPIVPTQDDFGSALDSFFDGPDSGFSELAPSSPKGSAPAEGGALKNGEKFAETAVEPVADPLDGVDDIKEWTPQAARRFKELKAEAKATKARTAELESTLSQRDTRLQELEALANDPKVKELINRSAEYEQAMLLNDLENSRAYQTLVRSPLERITGELDGLAEKYSISGDELIDVVVMDDGEEQEERLSELLANASDRDKFKLYKLIEETKPVLEQRQVLHENAREALAEVRELETQQEKMNLVDRVQRRTAAAQVVAKRIEAKLPFLTTFDGVDLSALAKEAGQNDYSKLDPAIGTYNTMAGKLLPTLATQYLALQREISSLTDKLAEYDRIGSPLNSGHSESGGGSRAGGNRSFEDAIELAFRG